MRRALAFSLVLLVCCGGLTTLDGESAFDTSDDAGSTLANSAPDAASTDPAPPWTVPAADDPVDAGPACVSYDAALPAVDASVKNAPATLDQCRVVGLCSGSGECPAGSQCVIYSGQSATQPSDWLCISERPSQYGDFLEVGTAFACPPGFRVGFRTSNPPSVFCRRDLLKK